MSSPTSGPSRNRNSTSSNIETSADSRQVLLPTQVVGSTNNGSLPLHSLPLQMMNPNYALGNAQNGNASQSSSTQNGNPYASFSNAYASASVRSSQEFVLPSARKEEPVDIDATEIPLSLMQAYNYQAMSQNALQTGCLQFSMQLSECKKEKRSMSMEIDRLTDECSQLEKERNYLENSLAGEKKECLKKQKELHDCKVNLDGIRKEAKQRECYLQKEIADGNAKAVKIEELQKRMNEIERKSEETAKELQKAKDVNRKIVDEYYEAITKPSTLNKLLSEQLKNQVESPSQYQMSTILANNILESNQSQEKILMIEGTSTAKGTIALRSKKLKNENDSFDSDTRAGDR